MEQPRRCPHSGCNGTLFPETAYDLGVRRGREWSCYACGYVAYTDDPLPYAHPERSGPREPRHEKRRLG